MVSAAKKTAARPAGDQRGRLEIGIMLPQEEGPGDPAPSWNHISEAGRLAEQLSLDSVWLVDHMLWERDPWTRHPADYGEHADPRGYGALESWTTMAGLAAVTSKVKLGTLVTCTRYRNPALLAKMADTVDGISGGRLVLGLGGGDNLREHELFGFPTDRPVSHFEEALRIIVPLLRTGHVDYDGVAYSAHAQLKPRGARPEGPPILIGSLTTRPRMLSLVAKYADIWNGWIGATKAAQIATIREAVDAACRREGRSPETLKRSIVLVIALSGPMARSDRVITGSRDEIAETIAGFAKEGIHGIQVRLFPNGLQDIERFGRIVECVRAIEAGEPVSS